MLFGFGLTKRRRGEGEERSVGLSAAAKKSLSLNLADVWERGDGEGEERQKKGETHLAAVGGTTHLQPRAGSNPSPSQRHEERSKREKENLSSLEINEPFRTLLPPP